MPEIGSRPILGELQRVTTPRVWLWCERCQHHAPFACAVAVVLWGPNASSDKLRAGVRCTGCGSKGAAAEAAGLERHRTGDYRVARGVLITEGLFRAKAMHIADYIAIGILIACVLAAVAGVMP